MPFDGTNTKGSLAVQMIDSMLELFGEDGQHWCQGVYKDRDSYCLVGAMTAIRAREKIKGDRTAAYIKEAIPFLRIGIMDYNDFGSIGRVGGRTNERRWPKIKETLLRARELAEQDI